MIMIFLLTQFCNRFEFCRTLFSRITTFTLPGLCWRPPLQFLTVSPQGLAVISWPFWMKLRSSRPSTHRDLGDRRMTLTLEWPFEWRSSRPGTHRDPVQSLNGLDLRVILTFTSTYLTFSLCAPLCGNGSWPRADEVRRVRAGVGVRGRTCGDGVMWLALPWQQPVASPELGHETLLQQFYDFPP
jgi:hypothetical protein